MVRKYIWNFNTDIRTRDNIIFGSYHPSLYGVKGYGTRKFSGITSEILNQLKELNFLSLEERQNCAPSIGEIMEFMEKNPGFTAHGYTVSNDRMDYRISIEGVAKSSEVTESDIAAFCELFSDADEFECEEDSLYCWYD